MNDFQRIQNIRVDRIDTLRKKENVIGGLLADLVDYMEREQYQKAVTVAAYLFFEVAKRTTQTPFKILYNVRKQVK